MEVGFAHWKYKDPVNVRIELLFELQRELIDLIAVEVSQKDAFLNSIQARSQAVFCSLCTLFVIGNVVNDPGEHEISVFSSQA